MDDIQPGDEVICINSIGAHSGLLEGSIYKVKQVDYNKYDKNYNGVLLEGFNKEFFMSRFKKVNTPRQTSATDVGDTTYYGNQSTDNQPVISSSLVNTLQEIIDDNKKLLENISNDDKVHNPAHYTNHPSGIECIQITEHMNFCLGNAVKYIWRADLKGGIEDLQKAVWYLNREINNRNKNKGEK